MAEHINQSTFTKALYSVFEETFEKVQGIYLDGGTSLFETLAQLDAKQASQPIVPNGSTIVAHTSHIQFYLDVLAKHMKGEKLEKIDWAATWKIKTATASEWNGLVKSLQATYQRVVEQVKAVSDWNSANFLEGALAIIVHTAFHLGAIRQIRTVVAS